MQDELNANELAQTESLITERQYDESAAQTQESAETERLTSQCQYGVCMVTWKPQRSAAA